MIALLIFCVAAVSAAPYYGSHHFDRFRRPYFDEDVFDTGRFWAELSNEMRELDNMLAEFYGKFPTTGSSTQGIDGNEYKVTIPLTGFEEKDIVVKARVGVLMVQAIHKQKESGQNTYLDVRALPDCVNVNGSWTYSQGVLKIVFPFKADAKTESPAVHDVTRTTQDITTQAPNISREEIENQVGSSNQDADVGLTRGDTDKERQLPNNEMSSNNVEATTYTVDLKDEIEFVPVRY